MSARRTKASQSAILSAISTGEIPGGNRTIVVNTELVMMLQDILLAAQRGEITALAFVSTGPEKFRFDQRCLDSGQAMTLLGQLQVFQQRLSAAVSKDLDGVKS